MSDFKAKMNRIDFHWGSALDPTGGYYTSTPRSLDVLFGCMT